MEVGCGLGGAVWVYFRKVFSWVLAFCCLLCVLLCVGFLVMFYSARWVLYQPFLLSASFLWVPVFAAVLDLFPVARLGHVKVRRLGVHHFVYGFVIVVAALVFIGEFSSLWKFFVMNSRDMVLVVGRVIFLVGLTLVVDDFADISRFTRKGLQLMQSLVSWGSRLVHGLHAVLSLGTFLVFVSVFVWLIFNPHGANFANLVLEGCFLVVGFTGISVVGKKIWLKMN